MTIRPLKLMEVTSPYGIRKHPITKKKSFHTGIDLSAETGTPCYAVSDGIVKVSKCNNGGTKKGYGYYLVIEHDGFCTLYAHLSQLGPRVGTRVKKGQIVAYSGNTGSSTAPHLHFEVRKGWYDSNSFWRRNKNGNFINAVDPSTFEIRDNHLPNWPGAHEAYAFIVDNGLSDGSRPNDRVSRIELWVMLYRAIKFVLKRLGKEI